MSCSTQDCPHKIFARGLCQRCYTRLRRTGSVQRTNAVNFGMTCSEEGCDKPAHAKGLCTIHYDRAQHPLNHAWRLLRSRNPGTYPEAWDRFDAFLACVGERPTPAHQMRRVNPTEPFSETNWHWLAPINPGRDHLTKLERSAYAKAHNLQRRFGMTTEDYDRMLAAQGGVCAICSGGSTQVHRKTGKLRELAVDHDHVTGKVRALLCTDCNTGLGLFNDSADLIRAAADYLDRHSA